MKTFEAITLDAKQLGKELDELEAFLKRQRKLKERIRFNGIDGLASRSTPLTPRRSTREWTGSGCWD